MSQTKTCSPACPSFKCAKNSTFYSRSSIWCRWTEEPCSVSNCTYAMCMKRRLLPGGVCGETVKRKTVDKAPEEFMDEPLKLRGKILRKIGDDEFY